MNISVRCPFCELPDIQERVVARNTLAWAFLTNIPITQWHTLVAPVRCVPGISALTHDELLAIFSLLKHVQQALVKTFSAEGFNYAWNEGQVAGQSVPHVHVQVIPRKSGDKGIYEYEPRHYLYLPGRERPISDLQELKEVAELIKQHIV